MLERLKSPATTLNGKITNIGVAFAIMTIWIYLVSKFLDDITIGSFMIDYLQQAKIFVTPEGAFFFSCIWAPIWEETVFRYAPMKLSQRYFKDETFAIIIIGSCIFGWGHGLGPISLLIQGMMGMVFYFLYLKNNNSLLSSIILHSMWNSSIFFFIE